jgi:hypothetical protein
MSSDPQFGQSLVEKESPSHTWSHDLHSNLVACSIFYGDFK